MLLEYPLLAALVVMLIRWFTTPADRKRTELLIVTYFCAAPALAFAEALLERLVSLLMRYRLERYDLYIYNFDRLLGNPSFVLGRCLASSRFLTAAAVQVYDAPTLMMVAIFTIYVYLRENEKAIVLKAYCIGLFAEVPIYFAIPVCGPIYAFPDFPRDPGPVVSHPIVLAAVPNGVPSIHMTLALLCALLLWPWKWGRVVGVVFVALTLVTILGNGQHYLFDVFAAIPYTWLVWKLAHLRRWPWSRAVPEPEQQRTEVHTV